MTYLYEKSGIWDIKDRKEVITPPSGMTQAAYSRWLKQVPQDAVMRLARATGTLKVMDTIRQWGIEDGSTS